MPDPSDLASALAGYGVPQEAVQHPYGSLAQALAATDDQAHTAMWGQPGTTNRQVAESVANYLRGMKAMQPKSWGDLLYLAPGVSNALSARDAYNSANEGDWRGAAGSAIGAIPFLGGMTKAAKLADEYRYVRRTKGPNPDNGVGYMMFLDSKGDVENAADALHTFKAYQSTTKTGQHGTNRSCRQHLSKEGRGQAERYSAV